MKKHGSGLSVVCLFVIAALTGCAFANRDKASDSGMTYYVSLNGDDLAKGSKRYPWKSIEKVNATIFRDGDAVYFEGKSTFDGTIKVDSLDSGSERMNLVIGSYGDGRAVINGGKEQAMMTAGCDYLEVRDIVFTGAGRKEGNTTDGISITGSHNLFIENLDISGFQHSGLHVQRS